MSPSELWCSVIVPWRLIFAISFWEVSMELMLGSAVVANTQLLHIPCWCFHRVTPLLGICAEREITQEMMGSSQEVQKAGGEMEAEGEVDSHVEKWKCSGFWMEMREGKRTRWHDVVWALVAEHRVLPSWWHGGRELSVVWLSTYVCLGFCAAKGSMHDLE